ncbi:hypothetical protein [Polyangium spumosum]|uniref:DUF3108 domain-containing protein n=1 Tax=Polyangium spumosum TaxID=889282 RepID=A0A6N7PWC3_9BACT|nr:hypothetical protein [Polyangium spumosum]MRG96293.1 hypothetical protein [Polyangium spumosum]
MRALLRASCLAGALFASGCGGAFPFFGGEPEAPGIEAFEFDESKVPVGVAYHYVKSNTDGSKPERVSFYVADHETIESFKFQGPRPQSASHVLATMDWTRFLATRLESRQMTRGGAEREVAVVEYTPMTRTLRAEINGFAPNTISIEHAPFHVHSFDLGSLNLSFRYLKNPLGSFKIGIANPTYAETGPIFVYRGEVTVSYVGDETRENTPCNKYEIDGPGLKNRGGFVWVDQKDFHIVDMELSLPNHPEWVTYKLKLLSRETMKPDGWRAFMRAQLEK